MIMAQTSQMAFITQTIPVPCLAHIQNVAHERRLKGEMPVACLLSSAKKLVGHFKQSPKQLAV